MVLKNTPFYAESGGQIGDKGRIYNQDFEFIVTDTQKAGNYFLHIGTLNYGEIKKNLKVIAEVNQKQRKQIMKNHTATHLLQAALKLIIGDHIAQAGSFVSSERLRFDYRHYEALTDEQISKVENIVNEKIQENIEVYKTVMDKEQALKTGATAIFGEKYGEKVRVVKINDFSTELMRWNSFKFNWKNWLISYNIRVLNCFWNT